jgi:hypothetical protein
VPGGCCAEGSHDVATSGVQIQDRLIALGDVDLYTHALELVGRVDDWQLQSDLYFAIGEIVERLATAMERAQLEIAYRDDPDADAEIEAALAALERRAATRKIEAALKEANSDAS